MKRIMSLLLAVVLCFQPVCVYAQTLVSELPFPGAMVLQTPAFTPLMLKGIKLNQNPFVFDFILDQGNADLTSTQIKEQGELFAKYFLAALAVPDRDLWVNLSPVEGDQVMADQLALTDAGKEMLKEDYLLKQLTSTLIHPSTELGKAFWGRVYQKSYEEFGTTSIAMDTFHKVWITPGQIDIVEKDNTAFITDATVKVMLDTDYAAMKGLSSEEGASPDLSTDIMRQIIVPAIEKEVNEGLGFAKFRQLYHAMALGVWYKERIKSSFLNKVYSDQKNVLGIDIQDQKFKEKVYAQYLEAYQKGVFDFIKEEKALGLDEVVSRKYFSGGLDFDMAQKMNVKQVDAAFVPPHDDPLLTVRVAIKVEEGDFAQTSGGLKIADRELIKMLARLQKPKDLKVVADVALEAFISQLKGKAQLTLGKGGLGFLQGETWGRYARLLDQGWAPFGFMPLYKKYQNREVIDWDNEEGINPVWVMDASGEKKKLSFNVSFNGRNESVDLYWINHNGTPILMPASDIFYTLYPGIYGDGQGQELVYGFIGRVFVETMKILNISPDVLRLSEPQLIFVRNAVQNAIEAMDNVPGQESIFKKTRFAVTTHTPEAAALPKWSGRDINRLKLLIGTDLVRQDTVYMDQLNAAGALAYHADIVNGVSLEHGEITKIAIIPGEKDKVTGIQNGSDPVLWYALETQALVDQKGVKGISGEELNNIGKKKKEELNVFLKERGETPFSDISRPTFGLVRRLVEYKAQGSLLEMVEWITGDMDKQYSAPWLGQDKMIPGLGANLLIGGEGNDDRGKDWAYAFDLLKERFSGKFVYLNQTGIEVMKKATQGCDSWLVLPWLTREASGTSDQRAGLNGRIVIATNTGGPKQWITNGVSGYLIDPLKNSDRSFEEIVMMFQNRAGNRIAINQYLAGMQFELADYMQKFAQMYREDSKKYQDMTLASFRAAHENVHIGLMVDKYGSLFNAAVAVDKTGQPLSGAERVKMYEDGVSALEANFDFAQSDLKGGIDLTAALAAVHVRKDTSLSNQFISPVEFIEGWKQGVALSFTPVVVSIGVFE